MKTLSDAQRADLQVRKSLGRGHLTGNRLGQALGLYAEILQDYPEDVEAYLVLGDLYLASDDPSTARQLYTEALRLDPENPEIERRIKLTHPGTTISTPEPVPTNADAIGRLLQRLTNSTAPVTEQEISRAADLLTTIIHSHSPAEEVSKNLEQIDRLLPALLELNIRQARADSRPDLAEALENLQTNIELQIRSQAQAQESGAEAALPDRPRFQGRVLILALEEEKPTSRLMGLSAALEAAGCDVKISSSSPLAQEDRPDVVIVCNPHVNPRLLENLATCTAGRIPLILDLDADFEHLPVHDPEYERIGLSTPEKSRAYTAALLLANLITVPSETMAASLREAGYSVHVVPDAWTSQNPLWEKPAPARNTVNIGWVGYPGRVEDVAQIRRVILRVLREFPETQLVIARDVQVFQLFDSLPPNRRLFLPAVDDEDHPYLLGQMDLILAPLQNNPYNYSQSDRLLMEAGVKGIPWIASPIPALASWEEGGVIANSLEEWHTYMRQFVLDAGLRRNLGQEGRRRAETREAVCMRFAWLDTIEKVCPAGASQAANIR